VDKNHHQKQLIEEEHNYNEPDAIWRKIVIFYEGYIGKI